MDINLIRDLLTIIGAGVVASFAMIVFMYAVTWTGIANGDMVRALGSIYTERYENSLLPGLIFFITGGIIFALIYAGVFSIFDFQYPRSYLYAGALFGFAHGWLMSFIMAVSVAEWHPLPKFHEVGFGVAITHVIGHVVYGATLGCLLGMVLV
jgi:uncharacterized membrane protein YagU involved in acid resistance